jgi:guanylate kinase
MRRKSLGRGIVFVLSAPSGTGKTTLIRMLLHRTPDLAFSVSHTTRARRRGEIAGIDYHFVSEGRFRSLRESGEFLEWARVDGASYGTSRRQLQRPLRRGEDVLLDIDTQGAAKVRRKVKGAVLIFLLPPDPRELRRRHLRRGTEPETMERRLRLARREIARCGEYDYLVLNDRLGEAARNIEGIIRAERSRALRQRARSAAVRRAFRPAPPSRRTRSIGS